MYYIKFSNVLEPKATFANWEMKGAKQLHLQVSRQTTVSSKCSSSSSTGGWGDLALKDNIVSWDSFPQSVKTGWQVNAWQASSTCCTCSLQCTQNIHGHDLPEVVWHLSFYPRLSALFCRLLQHTTSLFKKPSHNATKVLLSWSSKISTFPVSFCQVLNRQIKCKFKQQSALNWIGLSDAV